MDTTSPTLPIVRLKDTWERASPPHPWIYGRQIEKPTVRLPPGTVAELRDAADRFLGRGFYNGHARVGFRILTTDAATVIDDSWLLARLAAAVAWRADLGLAAKTSGMRLVNSEGDGLGGLVVDRFADVVAVQFFSAGMFRCRERIRGFFQERFPTATVYWFADERIQKQESFDCWAMEPPPPVIIAEHGVRFEVQVGSKHKTGYFADQRDNRLQLTSHTVGKRVLDLCCHTGGFALYAKARGQAREVIAVDLDDAEALPTARANAAHNGVEIDFQAADVYAWLKDALARQDRFDVVILDPAKQTRSANEVDAALRQYVAMNRLALGVVKTGGVLVTCSCSGLVSEADFVGAIRRAAQAAGREVDIFRLTGAGPDHPFSTCVPEGRYLKVAWCRVR